MLAAAAALPALAAAVPEAKPASRILNVARTVEISGLQRIARAPQKAAEAASKYDGTYILTLVDDIFTNSTGNISYLEVDVTVGENTLTIACDDIDPIVAEFDEEKGVATFVNQYVGAGSSYAYSYFPVDFRAENPFVSFSATFNADCTELKFPPSTGIMEGAWGWKLPNQKSAAIAAAQAFDQSSSFFVGFAFGQMFSSMTKGGMTFTPAGKVTFYDGLMTVNDAVSEVYSWDVEIEKCNEAIGVYRLQPYAVENPVGKALGLGVDTETAIYLNTLNPSQVFTKGQFSPYGVETFCGMNAENNFQGECYGTFEDGVIEFPDNSFAYAANSKWYIASNNGQPNMLIVFEGATVKDYTLEAYTPSPVSADNKWTISLTKGADVASVSYMVFPTEVSYAELTSYGFTFSQFGTEVTGDSFTVEPAVSNIFNKEMTAPDYAMVFIGAMNAKGEVKTLVEMSLAVVFADSEEGWATVGTTSYTDPFIAPLFGESVTTLNVPVQAKTDNSPVYRLVNPYTTFPDYFEGSKFNLEGMDVSLVIDATSPQWVSIPAYMSGVEIDGYGFIGVGNIAALGYTKDDTMPDGVNPVTMQNNVVNVTANSAFIHMPYYNKPGIWTNLKVAGSITLPAITVELTVKDKDGVAVEGAKVGLSADAESAETDAAGHAVVEVPFSTGYFGTAKIYVNGVPTEVKLAGAENLADVTVDNSAIEEISAAPSAAKVYDLQGRGVAAPTRGLYVIDGKKIMVK